MYCLLQTMKPEAPNSPPTHSYRGAVGGTVRRMNLMSVMRALRSGEVKSSSELRLLMGVNASTIARLLTALTAAGLVLEEGEEEAVGVGRRPKLWRLNPVAGYVVGLHCSGCCTRAVVMDLTGTPVSCAESTDSHKADTATLGPRLRRVAMEALEGVPGERVLGAGVGSGGVVDPSSGVLLASGGLRRPSGESATGFALRDELARALPWPVMVGNDAKLAALAVFRERVRAGDLPPDGSLVYMMCGEDPVQSFSLGIVIGGRLYAGRNGAAGEVLRFPEGVLPEPRVSELFRRAAAGDGEAAAEGARAMLPLLTYLTGVALSLDPDWIVLGGAYTALGESARQAAVGIVESTYTRAAHLLALPRPQVSLDTLWPSTVELGAAGLVLDELFSPAESDEGPVLIRPALVSGA